jgi:NAD(P)H-flavin reductase
MEHDHNLYEPIPMRIARVIQETNDGTLKSFELVFENPQDKDRFYASYNVGQFCQLSIFGKGEAPFGIANAAWEGDFVRFTVQKMGSFTQSIHKMKAGDAIGMRGPLGNGFPVDEWQGKSLVIIGGGCAFSTLYALTKHVLHPPIRPQYNEMHVIYGARTSGMCIYKEDIASWYGRDDLKIYQAIDCPEDGWCYYTGFVPVVTKQIAPSPVNAVAVLCGPPAMVKYTLPVLTELGFAPDQIFTSLEKRMKCGVGKCGRCNIGPKYVCKHGPVFSLAELQELPQEL